MLEIITTMIVLALGVGIYRIVKKSVNTELNMTITETEGDLLDLFSKKAFSAIAHGCNCTNVMGAGIAKQIRGKYPKAYATDKEFVRGYGFECIIGLYSYIDTENGKLFNLYTQLLPGANARTTYIRLALDSLFIYYTNSEGRIKIGIPLIGCGIGGLNYEHDLLPLVKDMKSTGLYNNIDLVIVHYKTK